MAAERRRAGAPTLAAANGPGAAAGHDAESPGGKGVDVVEPANAAHDVDPGVLRRVRRKIGFASDAIGVGQQLAVPPPGQLIERITAADPGRGGQVGIERPWGKTVQSIGVIFRPKSIDSPIDGAIRA